MNTMKGWLTRRPNGLYMLTYDKPIITNIGKIDKKDAYIPPGDPIGVNHICEAAAKFIWGVENAEYLTPVRVWLNGGKISD